MNQSTHSLLLLAIENKVGPAGLDGAARPKIFEFFCEVLLMQNFQILNMGWLKFKHDYARWKENLCKEKLNYPICNAMIDMCHIPYGEGSGLESGAGLSIPLV